MGLERKQRTHSHLRHYVQKRKEKNQTMKPPTFSFQLSSLIPFFSSFIPNFCRRPPGHGGLRHLAVFGIQRLAKDI